MLILFGGRRLRAIEAYLAAIFKQGVDMSHTMQDVLADLDDLKQKSTDYIAGRDAIDADLKAQLAAALAAANVSAATQADIDAAFQKAEEAKALLAPPADTSTPADTPPSDTPPADTPPADAPTP